MWESIKKSILANLAFLLLAVVVGIGAYNVVSQALMLRGESKGTDQKIQELLKKKRELEAYAAELESRGAIEREAKKRLNLKLPGEKVVVVPEVKNERAPEPELGFLAQTRLFFGKLFFSR